MKFMKHAKDFFFLNFVWNNHECKILYIMPHYNQDSTGKTC